MKELLVTLAGLIALGGYVPYTFDILRGRAQPARSARVMFVILLSVTLLQQLSLHSGLLVTFTVGELVGSVAILAFAIKFGVGGWNRLDIICYCLLIIDVIIWLTTGSALIALHLSILADIIAFTPTLVKTWRNPKSETPIFFITGIVASPLNIVAVGHYSYSVLLFPVYICLANLLETLLIVLRGRQKRVTIHEPTEPVV